MQMKSFRLDRRAVAIDAGRDMHLEAGVAGGARHRQAMRDEVPVLGHEIDDAARRRLGSAPSRRRCIGHRSRKLRDRADDVIEARGPRRLDDEAVVRGQLIEPQARRRRREKSPQPLDRGGDVAARSGRSAR